MPDLPERARAYLEALEADRLAALAVRRARQLVHAVASDTVTKPQLMED
jgi:hypothetical protein